MKVKIRHFGKVKENGDLLFRNLELWNSQRMSMVGSEFELIMDKKLKRPSPDQFSYLFGGIVGSMMSCEQYSHYNDPKELIDDLLAPMFLSYQVLVRVGKKSWLQTKTRRLSDLGKSELSDFIEKVLIYCAQEGIEILDSESYVQKFYREIEK